MNLKKIYKFKNTCRLCYKKNLIPVIDLKRTPLANSFSSKIKKKELTVPLKAYFCKNLYYDATIQYQYRSSIRRK